MKHPLYSLLDEYEILKPKNRLKILENLPDADVNNLASKISQVLEKQPHQSSSSLTLQLPFPSLEAFADIPNYLFLFEKVYMPDPLIDYLYWFGASPEQTFMSTQKVLDFDCNQNVRELILKARKAEWIIEKLDINNQFRQIVLKMIDKLVDNYVRYKELIEEDILVPVIDTNTNYADFVDIFPAAVGEIVSHYDVQLLANPNYFKTKEQLDELLSHPGQNLTEIFDKAVLLNQYFLSKYGEQYLESWHFLINTISMKGSFADEPVNNITFSDDRNKYYIDHIIQLCLHTFPGLEPDLKQISWPLPEEQINFPTLKNVPPTELLFIREKEKDALEKFRFDTQVKLSDIRRSLGTDEYQPLISKIKFEQQKQISEIKILASHIQKDHLRKSSFQLTTTLLSAAGAILSAIASTQAPLALVGTGIASAGFTAGISKLVETWISYKGEMDKLREKDSYILWKLQKDK